MCVCVCVCVCLCVCVYVCVRACVCEYFSLIIAYLLTFYKGLTRCVLCRITAGSELAFFFVFGILREPCVVSVVFSVYFLIYLILNHNLDKEESSDLHSSQENSIAAHILSTSSRLN